MGRYTHLLFDFDGTLADSFPFFVTVFNQLAARHRFSALSPADIERLRHLDARTVMRHVGLPMWRLPFVAADFRRLMAKSSQDIPLFEATDATLRRLHEAGLQLAVVTSNAPDTVHRLLGPERARLIACVDGGSSIFGKRSRIRRVMRALGAAPERTLYVGDQVSDLHSARRAGVAFGAVGWGYASPAAFTPHAPEHVFTDMADLVHQVLAA
jgi:phosphoglycolate phosphatase